MSKGFFRVYEDPERPSDIHFQQIELSEGEMIPEEQLQLRDDVDSTKTTISMLFLEDKGKFHEYFKSLLSLAQLGLVGKSANPVLASRALSSLKHEILSREGGRIKNQHMKVLGKFSLLFSAPAIILSLLINQYVDDMVLFQSFLLLWIGCMAGVWLSFGSRKIELKFEELNILEKDRLTPSIRLIFSGLLTIVIGLLITTNAIVFELGGLSTRSFLESTQIPLIIGIFCGLSEQVLSTKISQHASDLIEKK